eukprot:1504514-Pleurochrysis_carterae.AAC.1
MVSVRGLTDATRARSPSVLLNVGGEWARRDRLIDSLVHRRSAGAWSPVQRRRREGKEPCQRSR